jgi:AcrR family transcriptional regulator
MPNKDELTNERRAQILQAAAAVFARSGVDGARMDDIVAESGLSKGTLYWYFDSKQEIVVALVDEVVSAEYEQLQVLVGSPGSVVERLGAFLDTHASILAAQPLLGQLGIEFYAISGRVPRIRDLMRRYYDEYIDAFVELLTQGRDRGELKIDRPAEVVVNLVCLIEGLTLLWTLDNDRIDLSRQFHGALASLLQESVITD